MSLNTKNNLIRKGNGMSSFDDMQKTAFYLANDICIFLGELIEELNVSSYIFRTGMERSLVRVLNSLVHKKEPIVMYPDSIPGFTLMVFRKPDLIEPDNSEKAFLPRSPVDEVKEFELIEKVINKFFVKNNQQVLVIENNDLTFALFPVSDTKRNLKAMELYITF